MRTCAVFKSPVREALHRLKYKQDIGLGEALSRHLIELYDTLQWPINLIVPLPLSQTRLRERGYNQSSLLARPLALARAVPYKPQVVERVRNTRPQVGLSAVDRLENVKDAFLAHAEVKDKTVLVIDDVTTTSATIQACSLALLTAGAKQVYAMTLARAVLGDDLPPNPQDMVEDSQPVQSLY